MDTGKIPVIFGVVGCAHGGCRHAGAKMLTVVIIFEVTRGRHGRETVYGYLWAGRSYLSIPDSLRRSWMFYTVEGSEANCSIVAEMRARW